MFSVNMQIEYTVLNDKFVLNEVPYILGIPKLEQPIRRISNQITI